MKIALWFPVLILSAGIAAQEPPAEVPQAERENDDIAVEEVVVSVARPGPGLWRVSKDEHELWVLGTVSPVPKRMKWDSTLVEGVIEDAGLVLLGPRIEVDADVGFFGAMALLPSAMRMRNNPEKEKLKDVMPADEYARFLNLKKRYMPRDRSIEKRRPLVAAGELYERSVERVGLQLDSVTQKVIKRAAKRNKLKPIEPEYKIKIDDVKALVKEFNATSLDDLACLKQTMTFIEQDLGAAKARATAWADGDIATLKNVPLTDRRHACENAIMRSDVIKKRGYDELPKRLAETWLAAAEAAIAEHEVSFAVLPMRQVMDSDGYLAMLAARGYLVEAPGE